MSASLAHPCCGMSYEDGCECGPELDVAAFYPDAAFDADGDGEGIFD